MGRRLTRLVAVAMLVGVTVTACGVPTQDHPQHINRGDVPFGLLDGNPRPASPGPTTR